MMSSTVLRVILVDDHAMVREALARVLADSGQIDVVGQAPTAAQAVEIVGRARPHVVILDFSLPDQDAPRVIERLLRAQPDVKILVLTVHENIHYAVRVLEAGAHGYLVKSAAVDELVQALRTLDAGGVYLSPEVAPRVLSHLRQPKRQRVGLEALSQREFDFLRQLGSGKSLQQCAGEMKISTSTASTYRSRIMDKLNLRTTAELIRFALEHDLVR